MMMNRPGYTTLDQAIAGEVRAEFARQNKKTWSDLADSLGIRRATLSARINGHQPFTTGQLVAVAHFLGTTAEAITAEAERRLTLMETEVA